MQVLQGEGGMAARVCFGFGANWPSESTRSTTMPTKSFHRTDRVSAQVRRDLGTIVHAAVRDHGLPSVSVSDVEISRDLAHAKVFVTALQQERSAEAVKGLKEIAGQLRTQLARAMKLRHVPELHFHYDDSVDRGERIDNLLRDLDDVGPEATSSDEDAEQR
ncbi:Ribosome-binding factor A [Xanthomonas phaseoli pv. phaseoli]|nr:Ribosome-binding factor A [Xanthomonas phaseoli pv. phaseoli]SON92010.1 Ribosome-binding factor A [Xanthomonas phaseoli pv. phaseoli]SON93260.1 Ribosome-binding factor A [Xanthomonas phaseoli pv. phaseoli]SOO30324.1 Ribosome-binding factor A [Xanthomonas phaseoli pv. phaseoli]